MRRFTFLAAAIPIAHAATLADVCTTSYVQASLPADGFYNGITIDASSVTASPVYNSSISGSVMYPDGTIDGFCNGKSSRGPKGKRKQLTRGFEVTMAYTHNGRDDQVLLNYWLPAPANFKNRYLATGGGGLAINSGLTTSGSLPGGLLYGAVAGKYSVLYSYFSICYQNRESREKSRFSCCLESHRPVGSLVNT
jgi:tannase